MQRCALHQLEWGGVYLAVVEVDLLIKLHLFPLSNLSKKKPKNKTNKDREGWSLGMRDKNQ